MSGYYKGQLMKIDKLHKQFLTRINSQPQVQEKIISNIWFHTMKFEKAEDFKMGHKHNFDHAI